MGTGTRTDHVLAPLPYWETGSEHCIPHYLGVYFEGLHIEQRSTGKVYRVWGATQRHIHVNQTPGSVCWCDPARQ